VQTLAGLAGDGLDGPAAPATLAPLVCDGRDGPLPFAQLLAGTAAGLVREQFNTEGLRLLGAPLAPHFRIRPRGSSCAPWVVFALAALAAGVPTPVGGSGRLADALTALVNERGGDVYCGVDVDQILLRDGRAVGVRTSAGDTLHANEAVIVSATPDQLYGR